MTYRSLFALAAFSTAGALFTACSSSNSSSGGATSLAGIPAITGPVTTSSSVLKYPKDLSKALMPVLGEVTSLISSVGKAQSSRTFGMKASDWGTNNWTLKSGPLCEMGQQVSELFRNGANEELNGEFFIGSSDLMTRNLNSRVEVLTPVENLESKKQLSQILGIYWNDTCQAWELQPDGQQESINKRG